MFRSLVLTTFVLASPVGAMADITDKLKSDTKGTLSVSGSGSTATQPDEAYISVGVVSLDADAGIAVEQNTNKMNALYATLAEFGVEKKDIQTTQFDVGERNNRQTGKREGVQVVNQVRITVCDLKQLGKVVGAVVSDGANSIRGLSYGSSKAKEHTDKSRQDACKNAQAKAEAIASAMGVKLGKIVSIREGGSNRGGPVYGARMAAMSESVDVPLSGGTVSFVVGVSVTWELDQ